MDLWNIDLLDTHLDLLDRDIPSKHFVCLQDVFKKSSRHVFKTSSRHVFKTSWRRLQRNNFSSSKTSSRRLGRRKIVILKTCWRGLQDMSSRRLQDQQMFAGVFHPYKVLRCVYNITINLIGLSWHMLLYIQYW